MIAYKNGKRWADQAVHTMGAPVQLKLNADRSIIKEGGKDLAYITVKIIDRNGSTVPDAANKVTISIEGPGEIVTTDNGDPASLVSFASKKRAAYFGLLLAIVRAEKGKPGTIRITATSPGLKANTIAVTSK